MLPRFFHFLVRTCGFVEALVILAGLIWLLAFVILAGGKLLIG